MVPMAGFTNVRITASSSNAPPLVVDITGIAITAVVMGHDAGINRGGNVQTGAGQLGKGKGKCAVNVNSVQGDSNNVGSSGMDDGTWRRARMGFPWLTGTEEECQAQRIADAKGKGKGGKGGKSGNGNRSRSRSPPPTAREDQAGTAEHPGY